MNKIGVEISAILPCYNVENFLPTIIDCIEKQSFQNFEIILVNDGGNCKQLQVMEELASHNEKIRIINQSNEGVSKARNRGLEAALGEWIVFIDPDDEIKPFYFQSLLDAAIKFDADIAMGGLIHYYTKEQREIKHFITLDDTKVYSKKDILEQFQILQYNYPPPVNKIFKSMFLRENQFQFPVLVTVFEDMIFMHNIFLRSNPRIALVKDCGYIYNKRDEQSAGSKYHFTYTQSLLQELSLRKELSIRFLGNESEEKLYYTNQMYMSGYLICLNFFRRGTPLSFRQQIKSIQKDILENKEIISAAHNHDKTNDNFFTKLYNIGMQTNNAIIIATIFKISYWLKYHFFSSYIRLVPYLRGYKNKK